MLVLGLARSGTARACTGRAPQVPRDHRRRLGCEIGPALRRIETAILANDAVYSNPPGCPSRGSLADRT
ncbi:hypothetical protein GS425_12000 [Rhodococcus hoagii]|nr:hypothetical protein [Prescottella equi]